MQGSWPKPLRMLPPEKGAKGGDDMLQTKSIVGARRLAQERLDLCRLESFQPIRVSIQAEKLQKRSQQSGMPMDRRLGQSSSLAKVKFRGGDLHFHVSGGWRLARGHQVVLTQESIQGTDNPTGGLLSGSEVVVGQAKLLVSQLREGLDLMALEPADHRGKYPQVTHDGSGAVTLILHPLQEIINQWPEDG